jgi:small subunit ribosomal protein S12e
MSDEEQVILENQEVEVAAEAPAGQMSVEDALQEVLRRALVHDGLARGLKEAVKALDRLVYSRLRFRQQDNLLYLT